MLTEILAPEERAIESVVARYQRVAGAVTRFARSLSGNADLRVLLGVETRSSDDEVVVDPSLFQAAYTRRAPVTPEEMALASALHEVVHLVSTDLEEQRPIPAGWMPPDAPPADDPVPLLDAIDRAGGKAAEAFFFALEDARQERQGLHFYPGARSVLEDIYRASITEAMANSGPLGQFALSCFLLTGGYAERDELERRADPRAAVAMADAAPFLERAAEADDPWEIAELALQLLTLARLHGMVSNVKEMESAADRKDREEAEQDAIAEGVDRLRLTSPVVQDSQGYDETKKASQARAAETGRKDDAEIGGDDGTDQILRVSQSPTVYLPTGQGGKLIVTPVPDRFRAFAQDGRAAISEAAKRWRVDQRHVSGELHPLFIANQRRGLRSGYDAGDLSPYSALFLGAGLYERMFERRSTQSRRSYAVSVLVDGSASMLQPRRLADPSNRSAWGLAAAMLGAWTLASMCDQLQINFEVAMFNRAFAARPTDTEWSYTRRRSSTTGGLRRSQGASAERLTSTVNHYVLSAYDEPWRRSEDLLAGMFYASMSPADAAATARRDPRSAPPVSMFEKAANVDELNLTYASQRMLAQRAEVRVLVVLADGMTRGSVEALSEAVTAVEHQGTTVLGIGIGDDTVELAYGRNQVVAKPEALAQSMVDGVRGALRRSLALYGEDTWWFNASRRRPHTDSWKSREAS